MGLEEGKRIINHGDGVALVDELKNICAAITAGSSTGKLDIDKYLNGIKTGSGPTLAPAGTEMDFNESPSLSTLIAGNTVDGVTCGVTKETIDLATFVAKVGVSAGSSISFFYYGSAWHKDSIVGDVITLSDYGLTIEGTPVANDYITVALATSKFAMLVADYDHYTLKNSSILHHAVLVSKNCVRASQQFESNPELDFANTKAIIPAGKYKITTKTAGDNDLVADGVWVFTLTKDIPLGGGLWFDVIGYWFDSTTVTKATNVPTTAKSYAADHSTILESVSITAYNTTTDAAAVDLGTYTREYDAEVGTAGYENTYGYCNFSRCAAYGSGDFATSIYRQWLNATTAKATWWKKKSIFKLKPANGWTDQVAGYAYQMDSDLMKGIQTTKVCYYMCDSDYNLMKAMNLTKPVRYLDDPDVTVNERIVTVNCIFFPLSIVEMGLGNNWSDDLAGNKVLALYDGSTNTDRIKYYESSAKYYWLRSTYPWYCYYAAFVTPSGIHDSRNANYANGVAPACTIG